MFQIKNGRNSVAKGRAFDVFKNRDDKLTNEIYKLIQEIWKQEQIPQIRKVAITLSLHKKDHKTEYKHHSGRALLDSVCKFFARAFTKKRYGQIQRRRS